MRPDLSYDGRKVLFAYCKYYPEVADLKDKADKANLPEEAFYHVYEMNIDGSGRRQLTHGRYDDFDARWLPSGEIVFLSTRKGQFLQTATPNTAATLAADLPDSYVRCGGDDYRPVPVFTLHAMDAQGGHLRPISAFENFEWTPAVANDGRILYSRWDYIDRFNGHFFSLWSANPDGSNPQLVYGNYTVRPQVNCEARPIPNSQKLVFTASAHHSIVGGSLVLLDRSRGTEGRRTDRAAHARGALPGDRRQRRLLLCQSLSAFRRALPGGLGRSPSAAALPRGRCRPQSGQRDGAVSLRRLRQPEPALPRPRNLQQQPDPGASAGPRRPRTAGASPATRAAEGCFLRPGRVPGAGPAFRGEASNRCAWSAVPPKVQPHKNQPNLGVSSEDPGKFLLGTVPVEADGSAYFRVPSGVPVLFQAVDARDWPCRPCAA